jgi:hypothetical protein
MKPTSGAEYRKRVEDRRRARKLLQLPSGAAFEIKKIDILACTRIFKKKKSLLDEIAKEQDEFKLAELLRSPEVSALLSESVSSPILVSGEATNENELSIRDIEGIDLIALFNEIIVFNDLDAYTASRLKFFREKPTGLSGGLAGGEVPQVAKRDRGAGSKSGSDLAV